MEVSLHHRDDDADIEAVCEPVCEIRGRDANIEIEGQPEIDDVVLEYRDTHFRAVVAELRAASVEVHVLVGEDEIDVTHVYAAQSGEGKATPAQARQDSAASERLGAFGEDRSCRSGRWHRQPVDDSKGFAAAGRADRKIRDAAADRVGDEADDGCVALRRRGDEVRAVRLKRRGVVRTCRASKEEWLLSRSEDEKLGDFFAQSAVLCGKQRWNER